MLYILVNLKHEGSCDCEGCKKPLAKTYVRDLSTGLVYHNPWCFAAHVHDSIKAIGGYDNDRAQQDLYR